MLDFYYFYLANKTFYFSQKFLFRSVINALSTARLKRQPFDWVIRIGMKTQRKCFCRNRKKHRKFFFWKLLFRNHREYTEKKLRSQFHWVEETSLRVCLCAMIYSNIYVFFLFPLLAIQSTPLESTLCVSGKSVLRSKEFSAPRGKWFSLDQHKGRKISLLFYGKIA